MGNIGFRHLKNSLCSQGKKDMVADLMVSPVQLATLGYMGVTTGWIYTCVVDKHSEKNAPYLAIKWMQDEDHPIFGKNK